MPKLGKIEKPSSEEYEEGRKLFCVPLVFSKDGAPEDYIKLHNEYWIQVKDHLERLEKTGKATKIYHESISLDGKEGLEKIKVQNKDSYDLVKSKILQGASLLALEDGELFDEYLDWGLCASMVRTSNVAEKVRNFFQESEERRDKYIAGKINDTLKDREAGMLLMRDEGRLRIQPRLQSDIHIFLVHPPALSDISRWIRDQIRASVKKQ